MTELVDGLSQVYSRPGMPKQRKCHLCGRAFTKTEHLQRHIRSHTKEKPFQCPDCGKRYGRNDTLLRHRKDHAGRASHVRRDSVTSNDLNLQESHPYAETSDQEQIFDFSVPIDPRITSIVESGNGNSNTNGAAVGNYEDTFVNDRHPVAFAVENQLETPSVSQDVVVDPLLSSVSENQFPSWLMDDSLNTGLFDAILADFGQKLSPSTRLPTNGNRNQNPNLKHLWYTQLNQDHQERSSTSQSTLSGNRNEMNDTFGQTLHQHPQHRPMEIILPSSEFLNLCIRYYFSHFHPIFPVIHAATFCPSRENSMLLLSMCSVGSLFTGSLHDFQRGVAIFEHLHKSLVASWDKFMASDANRAICMIQTALLVQTFGLLSGETKHLSIVNSFCDTVIVSAKRRGAFTAKHADMSAMNGTQLELEEKWRHWARTEELIRIALGLLVHDGELSNLLHHIPVVKNNSMSLPIAASDRVFLASRMEEWRMHYLYDNSDQIAVNSSLMAENSSESINQSLIPIESNFTAYAALERLTVSLIEQRQSDPKGFNMLEIQEQLLLFYQQFLTGGGNWDTDCLGLTILWHFAFMSLSTDFNLVEKAVGRDGQINSDDHERIKAWTNSEAAKRCLIHAGIIIQKIETLPVGNEAPIHLPRTLFSAGLACFCYTQYSRDAENQVMISEALDFPEFKLNDMNGALVLLEGYRQGVPIKYQMTTWLRRATDLLRRIGHWTNARKFATILEALIHNVADQHG